MIIATSTRPAPDAPGAGRRAGERIRTCRYLVHRGPVLERCSAEVVEEDGEVELCLTHLGAALVLISRRQALVTKEAA